LSAIDSAVALWLAITKHPVSDHVRAHLRERVAQVCSLALAHAQQQESAAVAGSVDGQAEASGMQL
jgi:hypothetical protein